MLKRNALLAGIGVMLLTAPTATARPRHLATTVACSTPIVDVQLVNRAMPPADIPSLENALMVQANTQLCRYWHSPRIRFADTPGAWTLIIEPRQAWWGDVAGEHFPVSVAPDYPTASSEPQAVAEPDSIWISHELMEMLVNPTLDRSSHGWSLEVADPVGKQSYRVAGWNVSDFVTPAWFRTGDPMTWTPPASMQTGTAYGMIDFERLMPWPLYLLDGGRVFPAG